MYWTEPRHDHGGLPKPRSSNPADAPIEWRNRDRVRTASAVLVICLRIGYDPPDVVKTDPCAKLECWVDPYALTKEKAMERIGKNLQAQYESLAATPKTRYKQFLDPPVEDAKKFCQAARKSAKNERVLFHYNGHGVPKPTPSGELWLFNKQYTQYIPVSLAEVIGWLGSPTIYVWDCSSAGNIVNKVVEFSAKRDADLAEQVKNPPPPPQPGQDPAATEAARPQVPTIPFRETIQLGACLGHEQLPMNPDLPADLFTCCLTSPIEIALRFFLLRNPLKTNLDIDMLLKIPGKLNDRRTPLGELTWIFTAVTDTIAWNSLPRDLFQKLFRHDLVVAALFRGFLLAERIMRFYDCTPISVPALPQTHNHPLWDSWDLAVDMCLAQLPTLLAHEQRWLETLPPQPPRMPDQPPPPQPPAPPLPYVGSSFFAEQLTAFEIWVGQGTVARRSQPEQLPVVLQVLLSQAHRLRALILLCKFLDLGPWAVNVALSIGIFNYVLRLLQAPAAELKPVLIYIWSRILAVYENCKEDLLKQPYPPSRTDNPAPYTYFVAVLSPQVMNQLPIPNVAEHQSMCAFILAICCRDYKPGRTACMRVDVFDACLVHLRDNDPLLRQWAALCIAQMWDDHDEAKGACVEKRAHEHLCYILQNDDTPEVRAAVMYALGTLLGTTGASSPTRRFGRSVGCSGPASGLSAVEQTNCELGVAMWVLKSANDGSAAVRRELVCLLSAVVEEHKGQFIVAAYRIVTGRAADAAAPASAPSPTSGDRPADDRASSIAAGLAAAAESDEGSKHSAFQAAVFGCMFKTLLDMMADPQPDVAELAAFVVDHVFDSLFASPLGPAARSALRGASEGASHPTFPTPPQPATVQGRFVSHEAPKQAPHPSVHTAHVGLADTLKRSATATVKSLAHLALGDSHPNTAPVSLNPSPLATPTTNGPPSTGARLNGRPGLTSPNGSGLASPTAANGLHSSASTDSLRHLQSRAGPPTPKFKPSTPQELAAIEATVAGLIAADEERRRQRRLTAVLDEPGEQVLPLKGTFFDFALQYYKESQMRPSEADEPGSVRHNQRVWRRQRNEGVIIRTQPMQVQAARARWDEQIGLYTNEAPATKVVFHQFESHILAADASGSITVYDWETSQKLNRFANGSTPRATISALKLVNEDDVALVLTGSADGQVRLFRHYESPDEVGLVASFKGITETLPTTSAAQDAGLVLEWQQGRGHILMGGNQKHIRIWDAMTEAFQEDIQTRANSCLTSLTCDQVAGNMLIAGFGDGSLRVYDRREPVKENFVRGYRGFHRSWVTNVHMQRGGCRELVSGR